MNFKIPDFPLGATFAAILLSLGLLFAMPNIETAWIWETIALVAIVLWALGAALTAEPDLQQISRVQADPERQEEGTTQRDIPREDISPGLAALIDIIKAEGAANRSEEQREDYAGRRREIITIMLLAGTMAAIAFQVREMIKVYDPIAVSASATVTQAEALKKQVQIATDTLREVQRAFINISELKQEEIRNGEIVTNYNLTPIIRNAGPTSARNVSIVLANPGLAWLLHSQHLDAVESVDGVIGAPPDPEDGLNDPIAANAFIKLPRITIGPNSSLTAFNLSMLVPANVGIEAQSAHYGKFFYGLVRYEDIYDVSHISKFCFRIDGFATRASKPVAYQGICTHWNCSDEDCKRDKTEYQADADRVWRQYVPGSVTMPPAGNPFPATPSR